MWSNWVLPNVTTVCTQITAVKTHGTLGHAAKHARRMAYGTYGSCWTVVVGVVASIGCRGCVDLDGSITHLHASSFVELAGADAALNLSGGPRDLPAPESKHSRS